jgi:AraC-like DNA-binding protein
MAKAIDKFADTTAVTGMNDVVGDALTSLHIGGSVLLRETYSPPWAITVPRADQLATLLDVKDGARVVAFHLVEFGHCAIEPEGGDNVLLQAGEMVVCFGGEAHRISQGKAPRAQPLETLLAGGKNAQHPPATGLASGTSLLCGAFMLHHTAFNPLFSALPRLMHTTLSRSGTLHNLSGVARLMAEEIDRKSLGGRYIVERLLEVLCAEAVRAHIETVPYQEAGWFQGIKDPVVGRALAAIHEHPGKDWSVQQLARIVAMSPSRFAARFAESLGDSPMAYVTKWRMNVACRQLVTSRQGIDQIAASVGYESQAAFNRAFKKHVGLPPAAWRTRERA